MVDGPAATGISHAAHPVAMLCGVDEAGRGSVMGPLVVGCVFVRDDARLREIGVRDSKRLSPAVRERMYGQIAEAADDFSIVVASAEEIDEGRRRMSLNEIEAEMFLKAAAKVRADTVYADCPDANERAFSAALSARIGGAAVVARHRADDTYPVVSAASIMAKVTRDRLMAGIAEGFGFDVGSGYPSDPRTMGFIEKWIKDNGRPPEHTRCSWEPVRRMLSVSANTRITDW